MLDGKVVVITGAGGGLGKELVKAFLEQGCKVAAIARSGDPFAANAPSAKDRYAFFQADVANFAQVAQAVEQIISRFGQIDVLFNNAAVYPKVSFLKESADEFNAAIGINVGGVANCCKAVLPNMIKNGFGRIYNVGSFADYAPIPKSAAYSASKGALHGLTKGIAADVDELNLNIQIHEWMPGHLNTQMSDFTGIDPALSASWAMSIVRNDNASKKNSVFENDHEWFPPKSLKQRIKSKLMFWV